MDIEKLAQQGRYSTYATMAGGIASRLQDIRSNTIKDCFCSTQGHSHRLEKVTTVRGVRFINDSKASKVNAAWYALESMNRPTVLIMGGQDNGNDYTDLLELAAEKVKAIVCIGLDNQNIIDSFTGIVPEIFETQTMNDAVLSAFYLSEIDDVVLLSPACPSFDLFEDYKDRGEKFIRAVQDL